MINDADIKLLSFYIETKDNEATAREVQLALGYKSVGSVNFHIVRLAKKLAKEFAYEAPIKGNGDFRWWPCLFEGRDAKEGFVWTLKPQVKEWYVSTYSNVDPHDAFYQKVQDSARDDIERRRKRLIKANKKPKKIQVKIWQFVRNPDVVAEILYLANGKCQSCGKAAPFKRKSDNTPYLEVHHKIQLANGGEDTVDNSIALCPNCHREKHFG
jgi:5-methylcytosine-specific restriction endonuclease McrA